MSDLLHTAMSCTHCRQDVPAGMIDPASERQFCCAGCRTAHDVIRSCNLEGYYRLLASGGDRAPTASGAARSFAEFDDPAFAAAYVLTRADGLCEVEFALDNIHCGACMWLIERLPGVVAGVTEARLSIRSGMVTVVFAPGACAPSRIASALAILGYTPHAARERTVRERRAREDRRLLIRIAIAGACAGNVMMMAFALYGGFFDGMSIGYQWLFRGLSAVIGTVCLLWPGWPIFRSAWASIMARTPNIDVPIVVALLAGGVAGVVNTVLGRGELYFDSLTMLVVLLLFGRFVSHKHRRWAADAVELMYSLTPFSARRVDAHGVAREVPAEALGPGDVVEIRAGESIPVDGEVISGTSRLDIALLTGETRPVSVGPLTTIPAGAVNLGSPLTVRATATGRDTRAGRLMKMVEDASSRRPGIIRFTDAIANRFILVVLIAAVLTFAWWLPRSPIAAVDNAIALLIVTCPCVLGIAAPIAVGLAVARASRDGILIKGGDVLETLARPGKTAPGVIVLDKTGTLTEGKPRIVRIWGDTSVLSLAAAVEHGVAHPLADAFREHGAEPALAAAEVEMLAGLGVTGTVRVGGQARAVFVGSELASREHAGRFAVDPASFEFAREQGLTAIGVVVDGVLTAVVGVGDRIRPDAHAAISRLAELGWSIEILSGDDARAVRRVGRELGLAPEACRGGTTPESKLAYIEARAAGETTVVMVGDGVNDAAALAAASVGIAVHGGAEASLAAADVYISRPGLTPIVQIAEAGPRMLTTIRRMLIVSAAYNILAGALAMTGLIHPMIAAAIMPLSSLSVLTVAVRSRAWRPASVASGPVEERTTPCP